MKIFNHDIMMSTLDVNRGVHLFSGRALGLSSPGDKVQLHPDLMADWPMLREHYARIGLEHSHDIIWDVAFEELAQQSPDEISVYFFGHAFEYDSSDHNQGCARILRQLDGDWYKVVEYMNSKNNFVALAHQLGVPVPQTECFESRTQLGNLEAFSYPCYVKRAVSDHGVGIFRCENSADLLDAVEQFPKDKPFQVQVEIQASAFLNLQYRVTSEGLTRALVSEQILDGCVHGGNRYPTLHQPWHITDPMAQWMFEQGMRGTFGFDVAVADFPTGPLYLAIECNPRYNGSSYPTEIAARLNVPSWCSETLHTDCRQLADLSLDGLEFDPITKTGVVLVNWGTIQAGKVTVLLAGSPVQQMELSQQIRHQWSRQPVAVS
ncbi:ATP-grasp domain-containing protein [Leptothoe sp. ISB3NOV94-8A]|uniref:ATP-grasp domain-containing protein n=1 Tax=Adonisia turfae CCMR0081 TaxID=2292702 RepID=A0A6M0RJ93_9CYAN|nr:ATP-grasp domain-containing protein [Adonisia turfae]NEZ56284.1 ATP-grasp domain-containing protein [Adonisia turfae CCMR0081]